MFNLGWEGADTYRDHALGFAAGAEAESPAPEGAVLKLANPEHAQFGNGQGPSKCFRKPSVSNRQTLKHTQLYARSLNHRLESRGRIWGIRDRPRPCCEGMRIRVRRVRERPSVRGGADE